MTLIYQKMMYKVIKLILLFICNLKCKHLLKNIINAYYFGFTMIKVNFKDIFIFLIF